MTLSPHRPIVFIVIGLLFLAISSANAESSSEARDLINTKGCKGCHVIDGSGGTLGPNLDKVGDRLSREELRRQLVDPASAMPSFGHLPESELKLIIDYLESLK